MTNNQRPREMSQQSIFKETDLPPRGFIGETLTLIMNPIEFFKELGNRQSSPHSLWIAILVLLMLSLTALQHPVASAVTQPDFGGMPFEEMPFEQGFPPDGGGIVTPDATSSDPTGSWITVLTTIGKQIAQWGVLAVLLSLVTLVNGYMPPFGKNLEIAIWASLPLALMAGLQLVFMSGGGVIKADGFSGFLGEWETFATFDIYVQSIIHAIASQLTLFWVWSLGLLYLGMKFTLRGKTPVIIFTVVMWVVLLSLVSSFHSYDVLSKISPVIEEVMPDDFYQEESMSDDGIPSMDEPLTEQLDNTEELSTSDEQVDSFREKP